MPKKIMTILNPEYSLMVNLTLYIIFFKEKERLSALEKRYQSLTGGKTFSKPSSTKEVTPAMTVLINGQLTCFVCQINSFYLCFV